MSENRDVALSLVKQFRYGNNLAMVDRIAAALDAAFARGRNEASARGLDLATFDQEAMACPNCGAAAPCRADGTAEHHIAPGGRMCGEAPEASR